MKLTPEVMAVLEECTVTDKTLFLPPRQLDRKLYEAVNKCLVAMGGKWNRKAAGHVFDESPALTLEAALSTGEQVDPRKQFQFFPTPEHIARRMVELAEIGPTHTCLEPSAGDGAIARFLPKERTICIELYRPNAEKLIAAGYYPVCEMDFLTFSTSKSRAGIGVDRVVMNPPFTRNQDIAHVRHAYECLAPGGRIVAIMSEHSFFANDKPSVEFREWAGDNPGIKLPSGAFSTTGVNSRITVLDKVQ